MSLERAALLLVLASLGGCALVARPPADPDASIARRDGDAARESSSSCGRPPPPDLSRATPGLGCDAGATGCFCNELSSSACVRWFQQLAPTTGNLQGACVFDRGVARCVRGNGFSTATSRLVGSCGERVECGEEEVCVAAGTMSRCVPLAPCTPGGS